MNRPKVKPASAPIDTLLDLTGWILLVWVWAYFLKHYASLPEQVPVHYDVAGRPDGLGSRLTTLIFPSVATALGIGLSLLNRFPHVFNYPVVITESNAMQAYLIATRMMRFLKLVLTALFYYLMRSSFRTASGLQHGLDVRWMWVLIALLFVPVLFSVYEMRKLPKN